jgi:hypothetical protein
VPTPCLPPVLLAAKNGGLRSALTPGNHSHEIMRAGSSPATPGSFSGCNRTPAVLQALLDFAGAG